ncbi:uncharacterized protein DC041_0005007 [Schistosoma bovis]|uniref:Uncharacterized protein n=1 Tax=Schistosoma bovis TaxID=6184 RepID=A0A430Q5G4_SCHBO|nr:uncharacterized protein DC041_0005007 [Schistosoma bovis]
MNLTHFQYDLLNQFKSLGQLLAPFEDGGILNYLFEQITINSSNSSSSIDSSLLHNDMTSIYDNQSITLLKLIEINDTFTFLSNTINSMLFHSIQNINVYNVLLMNPNEFNTTFINSQKPFVTRKFIVLIIIEILLIFICFLLSMCYFIFLYPPNCIQRKSSLNYIKYLKITQVLRDPKYKNDMNNSNITDMTSDSLSNKYIQNNEMSRYTTEWMLRNEENISINSSDIYINIIQSLLETYQLSPVIESAESISYSINETVTASQIINVHQKTLQQDMNSYIGELRGYANILNKTLDSICGKLNENTLEKVTCKQLQFNNSILLINVDTKLFEFESSSILVFLMNDLNISLNSITDQFNRIKNLLNLKKDEVIQSMKSTFNLNDYFNLFTSIWILLQQNIVDKLNSYLTINKQQEIDHYLKLISYVISIIGYVIITLILMLITFFLIYCILYTVDIYNRNLFTKQNGIKYDPSQLFTLQIQGEFHKKLFLLQLNRSIYLPHIINYKHIQYLTITALIISLLFSFILFLLYMILPLLILFDTELCRYLNTDSGILITDFILDLYLQYQWSNFTLLSNDDLINYINLFPPKHVYSTIRNQCQPIMYNNHDLNTTTTTNTTDNTTNNTTNTTTTTTNSNNNHTYRNYNLLKLLNYSQIINFDKLLYSSIIQEKIKDAEISSVNKIINMDLAKFIPSDLDSLTSIARKLSVYLDGKDYKISSDPQRLTESIRLIFHSSIQSLLNHTSTLLNNQFEQLFANIIPCNNINKILMIILNLFCNRTNSNILSLGCFILIISISYFLLIITLFIFIIYSRKHIDLLIYTKWENIPLYNSVKLCYKLLKYN